MCTLRVLVSASRATHALLHSTLLPKAGSRALQPASGQVWSRCFNPKASRLGCILAPACSCLGLWLWLCGSWLCMKPVSLGLEVVLCWSGRQLFNLLTWLLLTPNLACGQWVPLHGLFSYLPSPLPPVCTSQPCSLSLPMRPCIWHLPCVMSTHSSPILFSAPGLS